MSLSSLGLICRYHSLVCVRSIYAIDHRSVYRPLGLRNNVRGPGVKWWVQRDDYLNLGAPLGAPLGALLGSTVMLQGAYDGRDHVHDVDANDLTSSYMYTCRYVSEPCPVSFR